MDTVPMNPQFFTRLTIISHKQSECIIQYDDPNLKIDWQLSNRDRIVSEKDKQNQSLEEATYLTQIYPFV